MTTGAYRTVVMDPPWRTASAGPNSIPCGGKVRRSPDYDAMSDSEIAAFHIDRFAAPESSLFIWSTHKKIPVALDLLDAWGFNYYFTFTWAKRGGLTMQGIHRSTEFAVFGYRGPYPLPYEAPALPAVFGGSSGRHSEKPATFYKMLRAKTRPPRIDIFARRRHGGFDSWGDQAAGLRQ